MNKTIFFISILLFVRIFAFSQPSIAWTALSYENVSQGILKVKDISRLSNEDIIFACDYFFSFVPDRDPYIFRITSNGDTAKIWSRVNTTSSEYFVSITPKDSNEIFLLTSTSDSAYFMKLNVTTGQIEFEQAEYANSPEWLRFYTGNVYRVDYGAANLLRSYSENGNLNWQQGIGESFFPSELLFYKNKCIVVKDSVAQSKKFRVVLQFDTSGTFLNRFEIEVTPSSFSEKTYCDKKGNLWLSGFAANSGYLYKLDSIGSIWDTLFTISNGGFNGNDVVEIGDGTIIVSWILSTASTYECHTYRVSSNNVFLINSIDSVNSFANVSLSNLQNDLLLVNNKRKCGLCRDYQITRMDSLGNIKWDIEFSEQVTTKEFVLQIYSDQTDVFICGELQDSVGNIFAHVLKLSDPTAIQEFPTAIKNCNAFINNHTLTLPLIGNTQGQVNIYNSTGALVYTKSASHKMELPKMPMGIYFVVVTDGINTCTSKILIENN